MIVDSLLKTFQQFQSVFCVCPHCSSLLRFSDLRNLRTTGHGPKTWLDDYELLDKKIQRKDELLSVKEDKLYSKEEEMREKSREKGRKKVITTVLKSMQNMILKKYNPYDIKPILHPVDFVIYNGNRNKQITDVIFLSKKSENSDLRQLQESIHSCVKNKNYDFREAKVSNNGKIEYVKWELRPKKSGSGFVTAGVTL